MKLAIRRGQMMIKLYKFHGGKWSDDINYAASTTHDLGLIIATLIHNLRTSGAPKVKESQIKAFSNEEARGYRKRFFKGK